MTRIYGSITNRFEEGKNFNEDGLIHEGDGVTMYYYSDTVPYFVTKVEDQKHIFVHHYHVVADRDKANGMGHQEWLLFKTEAEQNKYLNDWFKAHPESGTSFEEQDENVVEGKDQEWIFRYGSWKQVDRWTKELLDKKMETEPWVRNNFTEKELEKLNEGKEVCKYYNLPGKVSFGVASYYYDWSF